MFFFMTKESHIIKSFHFYCQKKIYFFFKLIYICLFMSAFLLSSAFLIKSRNASTACVRPIIWLFISCIPFPSSLLALRDKFWALVMWWMKKMLKWSAYSSWNTNKYLFYNLFVCEKYLPLLLYSFSGNLAFQSQTIHIVRKGKPNRSNSDLYTSPVSLINCWRTHSV
jgi:hypothetical protein